MANNIIGGNGENRGIDETKLAMNGSFLKFSVGFMGFVIPDTQKMKGLVEYTKEVPYPIKKKKKKA